MAKEFKIQTRFTGIDQLSRTTKAIAKNFGAVTRAAKATNKAITAVGGAAQRMGQNLRSASVAGVVGLTAALTPVVAFSDQINELEAVSMASAQQMAELSAQAKQLGSTTRFSASQAAAAQTFLARAGFETNQIIAATPDVLNLAAASNMELARTADIASNIMGAFKIEAEDMGRVADVLAGTTSAANVDLEQLADSLKFAAPIAAKAGLSLEETTATIGLLGNVGIQGTLAGTALRRMLIALAAPTGAAAKVLDRLGVKTKDAEGNLRKLPNILVDLSKGIKTLPDATQLAAINEIFGMLGITAGAELVDQAALGNLDKLAAKMMNVENRAQDMAETMNKGPGGAIRQLKSAAEGLAIAIGDSGLTGRFTDIVKGLTEFTSKLSQTESATLANIAVLLALLAVLSPVFLGIGAVVSALAPLISGIGFVAAAIGALLIPMLKKMALSFLLAFLVNPFGAIVVAIGAVSAALAALVIFWDDVVAGFKTGIDEIIKFFKPLTEILDSIGEIFTLFGQTVLGIGGEEEVAAETPERQSIPAQQAANQARAQATANARVEFVGTPETGVAITNGTGDDIDPTNGITAAAGFL